MGIDETTGEMWKMHSLQRGKTVHRQGREGEYLQPIDGCGRHWGRVEVEKADGRTMLAGQRQDTLVNSMGQMSDGSRPVSIKVRYELGR